MRGGGLDTERAKEVSRNVVKEMLSLSPFNRYSHASNAVGIQSKPVGRLRATDDISDELLTGTKDRRKIANEWSRDCGIRFFFFISRFVFRFSIRSRCVKDKKEGRERERKFRNVLNTILAVRSPRCNNFLQHVHRFVYDSETVGECVRVI